MPSNNSTWYEAGVEARRRMAAAGFDVAAGDTWAVNEFPSTVRRLRRRPAERPRARARPLRRATAAPSRAGHRLHRRRRPGRRRTSRVYQTNLQNWLGDAAFWTDMSAYVSDWSQEVYGDYRKVRRARAHRQLRRDYLNDYLQHALVLARVAPPTIEPAAAFLQTAFSPLANAAWQCDAGYGWTAVPFDQMESFVSAQVYALRSFSAATGQPQDHWGFAWAAAELAASRTRTSSPRRSDPRPARGLDPGLGTADPTRPTRRGSRPERLLRRRLAGRDLHGGLEVLPHLDAARADLRQPPQTIAAGAPSGPISLTLLNATGAVQPATDDRRHRARLQLPARGSSRSLRPGHGRARPCRSRSPQAAVPAGPFYYLDTRAGSSTITASAAGVTSGTQSETILPGAPISLKVTAGARTVAAGGTTSLSAIGADQYGNAVPVTANWTVDPAALGTVQPRVGATATFTGGPKGGRGTVTATGAGLTASAPVTVAPGPLRVAGIRYGIGAGKTLLVTVSLVDARGWPVPNAYVSVLVRRRGYPFFTGRGTTLGNGRKTFPVRHLKGCYRTTVVRTNANGYRWDGVTPVNRFCR